MTATDSTTASNKILSVLADVTVKSYCKSTNVLIFLSPAILNWFLSIFFTKYLALSVILLNPVPPKL